MTGEQLGLQDVVSLQIARLKETIRTQQRLLRELEQVASLMYRNEPLTVENFSKIMQTMKSSHERFWDEKKSSWNRHLDKLGEFLDDSPGESDHGGNKHE